MLKINQLRWSVLCLGAGFVGGMYCGDYGLVAGSIVFKDFRSKGGVTISNVFLVGERKFFRRDLQLIYKDFELYDKDGNRLIEILDGNPTGSKN